ncbi:MAG TPA: SDR family NAD(P)-dependent oxidoreductase, partial [Polyangiaceae bacterium]
MSETQIAQPASFAVQGGLTALLRSWGVVPHAVVGHSAGEVAAAYSAGVYDLEQAIEIIYHRSRLQHRTSGQGKLVAVGISLEQARAALAQENARISIAAVNSPSAVTLVGDPGELERFVGPYQASGVFVRFLSGTVPYHSHYMDPLRDELLEVLGRVAPRSCTIPLVSTVTGGLCHGREWDAQYWWRNVRDTVLFAPALEALADTGFDAFLEIGAHPVLTSSIQECFAHRGREGRVFTSLRRKAEDRVVLLETLAALHVNGFPVDWRAVYGAGERHVSLPLYPFQRDRHWVESEASERDRLGVPGHPLLGERRESSRPSWENVLDLERLDYLKDHVVRGSVVFPGAAYVEMMLSAAHAMLGSAAAVELRNLKFQRALFLNAEVSPRIELVYEPETHALGIASRAGRGQAWVRHASAKLVPLTKARAPVHDLKAYRREHQREQDLSSCYRYLKSLGLEYGPSFCGIRELFAGTGGALARIEVDAALRAAPQGYSLHPALLDAGFQVMLATTMPSVIEGSTARVYLPTEVDSVRIFGRIPERLWVRSTLGTFDERHMRGDLVAFDDAGNVVLELSGVVARSLEHLESATACEERSLFYDIDWELQSEATAQVDSSPGVWLVLADRGGFGRRLAESLERLGHSCVLAFAGTSFQSATSHEYSLDPARFEDVQALVRAVLARAGRPLRGILHFFSLDGVTPDDLGFQEMEQAQAHGPLALLHFVQALELSGYERLPRIWAVTRGTQAISVESSASALVEATVWGMMRVVRYQEHPDRFGGLIDLDPERPSDEVERFAEDLLSGRLSDEVAYRGGRRYQPRFVPKPELAEAAPGLEFRADASYLVTGGFGGLGLLVARWMVQHGARRLILVGRNALPARSEWSSISPDSSLGERVRAVRELEALGASVHCAAIDIAEEAQLLSFLEKYRNEGWPAIRGVIHAAGVSRPHLMAELEKGEYLETARPKVQGAWLLHRHLAAEQLDFFVLFSSVAAFAFTAGQADYAAANAFLDALARYRHGRGLPALSINWGPWAEAGMATLLGDYFHKRGTIPFPPASGLSALRSLLGSNTPQATVLWISDPRVFANNNFSSGTAVPLIARLLEATPEAPASSGSARALPESL